MWFNYCSYFWRDTPSTACIVTRTIYLRGQTHVGYVAHSGDLEGHFAGGFAVTYDKSKAIVFNGDASNVQSESGTLRDWLMLTRFDSSNNGGRFDVTPFYKVA